MPSSTAVQVGDDLIRKRRAGDDEFIRPSVQAF
jgi:hypothetical protein